MSLKAGIVGLPNVGKSTLFNAITNSHVEAANYPFATISPNAGVVNVPDDRLEYLASIFNPKRKISATVEFFDIAGLVKGASKGEGLGNQFLAHIRECDAIVEVVRCFENNDIIHVENTVDPIRDVETINLELCLSDLDSVSKSLAKVETKARINKDKESVFQATLLSKLKEQLEQAIPVRNVSLSEEERKYVQSTLFLLTSKPLIYVANLSDSEIGEPTSSKHFNALVEYAKKENIEVIPVSAEIESEISELPIEERQEFIDSLGIKESGLNLVVKAAYKILNLSTFFTVGADECRAWTFIYGMLAPDCAGVIHTDFKKGFIRAEVYSYDAIKEHGSELAVKEAGKLRSEGKEYAPKDGDIMFFKFNV